MQVIKRDGKKEFFILSKIEEAVHKAGGSEELAKKVSNEIYLQMYRKMSEDISIYDVQKYVEDLLMKYDSDVARSYIEYRSERDRVRDKNNALTVAIEGLVSQTDKDTVNENANKDARIFPTQRDLLAGTIAKHFARNYLLPKHIVDAHEAGLIHQHDMDYVPFAPMTNCCLVDLETMFRDGFHMGAVEIEKPKSIGVAVAVMAQITAQIASHQYGGTTFPDVDKTLAPYVEMTYNKNLAKARKYNVDDMEGFARAETEKEVFDAFQAYQFECLSLFSTNGQTPFVTLSFGMETTWAGRIIQKAILENRIIGVGKDRITPTFPKLVMFVEEGINLSKGDVNYDIKKLALECASKRFYPDIINAEVNREITGSSIPVSPMGCRSFLNGWVDPATGKEVLYGRNNLGVISLNLPRVALDANGHGGRFFEVLEERLKLCKEALMERIKLYEGVKASVAPILYCSGAFGVKLKPEDTIAELFKNGRSSISLGYVGLHETLKLLTGQGMHEHPAVHELGMDIISFIKDRVLQWKEETGYGFSLYATPAESLCYRFAKLDKKVYGTIKGVNELDYYTNSHHLSVTAKVSPFQKINLEKVFPAIASGGNISYVEFPSVKHNLEGLESVWDYVIDSSAHYFGTNTPSDTCFECKFEGEMIASENGFQCPNCGNDDYTKMAAVRRTCGYLGSTQAGLINKGKLSEISVRYKHFK